VHQVFVLIDNFNLTNCFRRIAILAAPVLGLIFLALGTAAQDRVVNLEVSGDPSQSRIEIRNPSPSPVTFTLGVNDQLFENQEALQDAIRATQATACSGLEHTEAVNLPCATFEKIAGSLNHHIELTDQFTDQSFAGIARWWASSPMLAVNSFGFGTCGTFAYVNAKLWESLGYDVRLRDLNGHTVTEVYVDERWVLFDGDLRGFFVNDGHLVGMDDLFANPELAEIGVASHSLPGTRPGDYPSAGLEYYKHLVEASTGTWRDVKEVPPGTDDWRELTFTLPPNSRLILGEPETSRCLYPENADIAALYGNHVTDPPFQYAVLELADGTTVDMENGLFPALVTGTYCLNAVYVNGIVTTTNFNEIEQFRYSRRFAREFQNLQATEDVKIHYMLNSKFAVRENNEVRLHGEGVESLEVVATDRPASTATAPPCIDPPRPGAVPVLKSAATSSSYGDETLAANLIDGKFVTRWTSALQYTPKTQMIVLDLGSPREIRGIRWAPDPQYGMLSPSSIAVQTSRTGAQIEDAGRVDQYEPSSVDWKRHDFTPRVARYVLLFMTPRPHFLVRGTYQSTLGEIEVIDASEPPLSAKRKPASASGGQ
jgi:F5/8 type C domain